MFYEERPVKEMFESDNSMISRVIFDDDQEPHEEMMHHEEAKLISEEKVDRGQDFWEKFVEATLPLRSRVMEQFENWNIRIEDFYRMRGLIEDTYRGMMNKIVCRVFGIQNAESIKIKDVVVDETILEVGLERDLLRILCEHNIPIRNVEHILIQALIGVMKKVDEVRKKKIGDAIGVPFDYIRIRDIERYENDNAETVSEESADSGPAGDVRGESESEELERKDISESEGSKSVEESG